MKILIPTAKELNLNQENVAFSPLNPLGQRVLSTLAGYSVKDLINLYKLSSERASEELKRIQALRANEAPHFPALYLFDGLMYRHIKRDMLKTEEREYLEKHVLITSALYGVIPAFLPIAPHRLDFQMRVTIGDQSLKSFWRDAYNQSLADEELILSLLSSEFETVFSKEVRERMISFKFMEKKDGQLKVHSTISKKARGAFLTALMAEGVLELEQIKSLTFAGFSYVDDLSTDKELVFVKLVS
ncbi:UPF0246 protein YaaA [Streptococcus sp. DD10]|uniref:peroxide stress protein YaaA n=1 Tax=Streptococcus sp. DD10 TaxID=1777878 RepID=UPI00079C18C8|nr:peroxide stress protein YaaA [Streptococcus sp. DD10]KXT74158.1 UPF0246 protein YaaA [Streptococcus sp. DD10]